MEKGFLFFAELFVVVILGAILGVIISAYTASKDPTSMDVYQGKTTHEYVVVDGQVTDSTVIWKKDIHDKCIYYERTSIYN